MLQFNVSLELRAVAQHCVDFASLKVDGDRQHMHLLVHLVSVA